MLQSTCGAFFDAYSFNHSTQFHFTLSPWKLSPRKADGRVLGRQIARTEQFWLVQSTPRSQKQAWKGTSEAFANLTWHLQPR